MSKHYPKDFSEVNGSFSGADIIANIIFPGCNPIAIGTASTITYSTYRETSPVRTLSRINVKGFSKGQRTIAGTIIFTVLQKHIVNEIKKEIPYLRNIKKLKPCELPPFDILFTMGNEYGTSAHMGIYGVTIVDEGKIFSIEDMFTENTWSYMARDIDLMDDIGSELGAPLAILGEYEGSGMYDKDKLVMDDDYVRMQQELDRLKQDRDAYIEELRKQANEYIGKPDGWVPGQDIIVIPEGGDDRVETPGSDPDEEKHPTLSMEFLKKLPSKIEKDDQWVMLKFSIKNSVFDGATFRQNKAQVSFKLKCGCSSITQSMNITDSNMYVYMKGFNGHTPTTPELSYTVTSKEVGKYTLSTPEKGVFLNYKQEQPVEFLWVKKGGSEDKENENFDGAILELTFDQLVKTMPGDREAKNVQYVFRDASNQAIIDGTAVPTFISAANYHTMYTLTESTIKMPVIKKWFKGSKLEKHKDELVGGFRVKAKITKDGKEVPKSKLKDMELRCNFKVTVTHINGKTYTIYGHKQNANIEDLPYWSALADVTKPGVWKMTDVMDGTVIYPTLDSGIGFPFVSTDPDSKNLADSIIETAHISNGCNYKNFMKYFTPNDTSKGNFNCNCDIVHAKLTLSLYNWTVHSKSNPDLVKNVSCNYDEITFKIRAMDSTLMDNWG